MRPAPTNSRSQSERPCGSQFAAPIVRPLRKGEAIMAGDEMRSPGRRGKWETVGNHCVGLIYDWWPEAPRMRRPNAEVSDGGPLTRNTKQANSRRSLD